MLCPKLQRPWRRAGETLRRVAPLDGVSTAATLPLSVVTHNTAPYNSVRDSDQFYKNYLINLR